MIMCKQPIVASVVTYNRKELLLECLNVLIAQTVKCDILIVDNASTDGTSETVAEFQNNNSEKFKIIYHNMGKNTGGTGGFNFAMRFSAENGYDFAWLMDDDCIPHNDALEKLLEADKKYGGKDNYGFLSSKVLWTDGNECRMNRPKFLDKKKNLVSQSSFVSIFLPTQTIIKAGLPIKDFFIWGDDIEYTRRLTIRMKVPCFFVPQSQVIHKMQANYGSSLAFDVEERFPRYVLAFRNEFFLYRQEGFSGVCFYIIRCIRSFAKILLLGKNLKYKRCAILFEGISKGLKFNPEIEYVDLK